MNWKIGARLALWCAAQLLAAAALAQAYPSKPIRFIVPTTTGGGSDLIARALGAKYAQA